jgi:ComF family protein
MGVGIDNGDGRIHPVVAGLRRLGQSALDWALPPTCMGCKRPTVADAALCPVCWGALRWIERPFCERLSIPFAYDIGPGALSAEAIADPPPFNRLRAVAVYDEHAGRLVQSLKYHDRTELAAALGRMLARAAADFADSVDVVIPIPLHPRRLWRRRFNQSALIGDAVALSFGLPQHTDILARIKPTRQQVGLKANERAANVQGAFRVVPEKKPDLAGKRVLLIDDVYTTGATVKAATRALLRGGAATVDVAVFARVVEGLG